MSDQESKLSERIWITRKSRIEAERRLNQNDFLSQALIIYYSIILVALSTIDLKYSNIDFSLELVIASMSVLCLSIFISSRNFKKRSFEFKLCYIKLHDLYNQSIDIETNSESLKPKDRVARKRQIREQYLDILSSAENHSVQDYLNFKNFVGISDPDFTLSSREIFYLYRYKTIQWLVLSVLFGLPVVLLSLNLFNWVN